ncbi:hypothetical protein FB451DRAFT_1363676 [Mycena latifolia]|nr:hypothetical protein FB451DRAFT_1363676 [Mycena latifolia]
MSPKDLKRHAYRGRSRDKELILIARKDALNERQAVYNKYAEIIESKRTIASAGENGAEGNTYELGPCAKNPTWRGEDIDIYLQYNFDRNCEVCAPVPRENERVQVMSEFRKIIKGDMLTEPRSFNVKELALVAEETACAALQESLGKKHRWKRLVAFPNAILRKVTVFFGFEARVPAIGTGASPEVERARASRNRSSARLCDAGVSLAKAVTGTGLKLGLEEEGRDGLTAVPRREGGTGLNNGNLPPKGADVAREIWGSLRYFAVSATHQQQACPSDSAKIGCGGALGVSAARSSGSGKLPASTSAYLTQLASMEREGEEGTTYQQRFMPPGGAIDGTPGGPFRTWGSHVAGQEDGLRPEEGRSIREEGEIDIEMRASGGGRSGRRDEGGLGRARLLKAARPILRGGARVGKSWRGGPRLGEALEGPCETRPSPGARLMGLVKVTRPCQLWTLLVMLICQWE